MRWLHDTDSLQGLAEEDGPIGQWARFHCAVRGVRAAEPTDEAFAGPLLLLGRTGRWNADMSVLEHAVAHGVIPSDGCALEEACRDGLSGARAGACADLLIRLEASLDRAELGAAARRDPEAMTVPAWIVAVQPETADELARNTDPAKLWASVALHLPTGPVEGEPLEVLEATAAAVGLTLEPAGKGAARRQLARRLEPLCEAAGAGGALVRGALRADLPVPASAVKGVALAAAEIGDPLERYGHGGLDARAVQAARAARVEPLETGVAIETGVLPPFVSTSVAAQQALAARCPDWVAGLLADPQNRGIALDLARFVPTEDVLEALFAMPVPREPELAWDLARALVNTGVPAVVPRVRQLADGLEGSQASELATRVRSFYRQSL